MPGMPPLPCNWPAPGSTTVWPQPCLVNYQLGAVSLAWCELCSPTSTCRMTNQLLFRSKELKLCPYLCESLCRSRKDRLPAVWRKHLTTMIHYGTLMHFVVSWTWTISRFYPILRPSEIIWIYLDLGLGLRLQSSWSAPALAWRPWWASCRTGC